MGGEREHGGAACRPLETGGARRGKTSPGPAMAARRIVVTPEIPEAVAGAVFEGVAKPATAGVPEVVAGLLAEAVG